MKMRVLMYLRERMLAAPIGTMLAIILVLGLIPAFVMGGLYVQRGLGDVEIIDKEREGVEMLRTLKPIENFLLALPDDRAQRQKEASRHWQSVKSLAREHDHRELLGGAEHVESLQSELRMIAVGTEGVDGYPEYNSLVRKIGDKSGLILDPELDTYYLMTISLMTAKDIASLSADLEKASAASSGSDDPLVALTRHRLADATRDLKEAGYTAVSSSRYDLLRKSRFLDSINATITASNQLNAARGDDVPAARRMLEAANMKSWAGATLSLDRLLEQRREDKINGIWISLAISGAAMILVIIFASAVIIAIANGVRSISDRLNDLAFGDYVSPVPGTEYRNDIGVIANALQDFIGLSQGLDDERGRAKAELERTVAQVKLENEKLLSAALEQQRNAAEVERATLARLAADLERQVSSLLEGSREAASKMDREAATMAQRSAEVQREASSASMAASEIRRTMEAVPQTVSVVARQLDKYTVSLGEANALAGDAAKRVALANQRMGDFSDATGKAAAMLNLIKQVSQKTNMLALNASIEAVRVGEAGKGFQVVANEVKALALSTRDAAAEIAQQIGAMEGANREMVGAFEDVMQVVETLAEQSAKVASGMNDQAAAIGGVETAVSAAASELSQMVGSIETADKSATATQQRSSEMMAASKGVSENVGALDASVRKFLGGIRSTHNLAA
jgi:methyl-accepting chemotaxis protein